MGTGKFNASIILQWSYWYFPSRGGGGGVEILLVTSCFRNKDQFCPDRPLGLNADLIDLPNEALLLSFLLVV